MLAHSLRRPSRVSRAPARISLSCAKMRSPSCAATINCLKRHATSHPAAPAGAKAQHAGAIGRSLSSLVALEFAVRDSHQDEYAQQLEPELGKLAVDIRSGFHHVAGCIHVWRFHIPPPR